MANLVKADKAGYEKAALLLRAGELVALPTDTVYGLAGLVNDKKAIANIFKVKQRPKNKALSIVIFAPSHAKRLAKISPLAQALMDAFWPGALTLVLPARADVPTLAIRCPDIDWTSAFLDIGFEGPLVLPSANISGQAAPTTAGRVAAGVGNQIPLILDGGTCKAERESTIIAVDGQQAKLLRMGAIAPERFAAYNIEMDLS